MFGLVRRLVGAAQPDGAAEGLEETALLAGAAMAGDVGGHRVIAPSSTPQTVIVAALGQKVLHSWLQNRHQTRFPLVLNLRNNSPAETDLLLATVRLGLSLVDRGDAAFDRAAAFVTRVGGTLERGEPELAVNLVARLHEARLTSEAYAACAGALGRRTTVARRFLDFLAARLDVPDEAARSINRRFSA